MEIKPFVKTSSIIQIGIFSSTMYMPSAHHHLEYELFYLDKGEGVFWINERNHHISAGDVIFVEPKTQHYFRSSSPDYHYYAFIFDFSIFGADGEASRNFLNEIKISNQLNLAEELLDRIKYAALMEKNETFGRELQIKTILYEIFSYIIQTKQYVKFSTENLYFQPKTKAVQEACDFINRNYNYKIDYPELINTTNYSKSQFIKLFKKQIGMNITDYINKCRIENACLALLKTEKSITEIATENGFNNVQYFSKKFKETMGCTPREYKLNAIDIIIPSTCKHL